MWRANRSSTWGDTPRETPSGCWDLRIWSYRCQHMEAAEVPISAVPLRSIELSLQFRKSHEGHSSIVAVLLRAASGRGDLLVLRLRSFSSQLPEHAILA